MNMKIGRYSLEEDVKHLRDNKCMTVAYSILPGYGYIIFWYDKQGYSVTVREGNEREDRASSVSGAMPYDQGLDHYLEKIACLAESWYAR